MEALLGPEWNLEEFRFRRLSLFWYLGVYLDRGDVASTTVARLDVNLTVYILR